MKVTYIAHSGVFISFDDCVFLIDYYHGEIPKTAEGKKVFVLSSHSHGDHFNKKVFKIYKNHENTEYILSDDIKKLLKERDIAGKKIMFVKADEEYAFDGGEDGKIRIKTLLSTDEGVAFLIKYSGKTIFHAGDLNLWIWEDNEEDYDRWMRETYSSEISKLKGERIDLAFLPLDGRLGKRGFCGIEEFAKINTADKICPIHMSTGFDFVREFMEDKASLKCRDKIIPVSANGYEFEI